MNKKKWMVGFFLCIGLLGCLNACSKARQNEEVEENVSIEEVLESYHTLIGKEKAERMALLYFDEDIIPELLFIKNGEYKLYSFADFKVNEINISGTEFRANVYGRRHSFEELENCIFYRFEYVPYTGQMRIHTGNEQERSDYYLRYTEGKLVLELKTKSMENEWQFFEGEKEISNKEFQKRMSALGYDRLIPCGYLYGDIDSAYENIGKLSDTEKILQEFVTGQREAVEYVEKIEDIPEDGFRMSSFEEIYKDLTDDEEWWRKEEYVDFDNDGEQELILHGYAGSRMFFDVIGEIVYALLSTGSTTDCAFVGSMHGENVIIRTDLLHEGREVYRIMKYDACGCLIEYFSFSAEYEGEDYKEDDLFWYNDTLISMEEYELLVNSIQENEKSICVESKNK